MKRISIRVDGRELWVAEGMSLAVALINVGVWGFRRSVSGRPRGPLCAMGTCYECRVEIDGQPGRRACLTPCRESMRVETNG